MCTVALVVKAVTVLRMRAGNLRRMPCTQAGLTYLWMLLALTLLSLGVGRSLEVYHQALHRERESELLRIGEQYRKAIGSYYQLSPGAFKQYPHSLADLLHDHRFLILRRHIRKLYADPMNPSGEWGLVRNLDGGITGVFSRAAGVPLKQANFSLAQADFEAAATYSEWQFVYVEDALPAN